MSGGGGSQDSTVTNKTDIPPWVQQKAMENLSYADTVANRPYESYGGQQVAGTTPDQQAAFQWVRDNLGTGSAAITAAGDPIRGANLTTTAQSLLNPYLGAVEKPALQAVADQGARAGNDLAAKASQSGAFGGTRFGVESGILGGQVAQKAGELSANIRSQGWDKAVSTALAQAGANAQIADMSQKAGLNAASALSTAGFQQQQVEQAKLTGDYQSWIDAQTQYEHALAIKEGALTSTPYGGTTTSTQPIHKANPALSAAGGALSGAAAGSMILPGWGTAAGALIGGAAGYLGSR
jgi:hypothetical protein